ncbi:MAG: hypothetical protein AB1416_13580, partial [Actinomycetota bacterium]
SWHPANTDRARLTNSPTTPPPTPHRGSNLNRRRGVTFSPAPTLYAGGPSRLTSSLNGGDTWSNLRTWTGTTTGIVTETLRDNLYVSASEGGIRRVDGRRGSPNPDHPLNAGLTDTSVTSLARDPSVRTLYAGTASGGVARLTLPVSDLAVEAVTVGYPRGGSLPAFFVGTVTNLGPEPVDEVVLRVDGFHGKATATRGTCVRMRSGWFRCAIGRLEPGTAASVTLKPLLFTEMSPVFEASGVVTDPRPANDRAQAPPHPPDTPALTVPNPLYAAPVPTSPPAVAARTSAPAASRLRAACIKPKPRKKVTGVRPQPRCTVRITFRLPAQTAVRIAFRRDHAPRRTALTLTRAGRKGANAILIGGRARARLAPGRYLIAVRPVAAGATETRTRLKIPSR